MRVGTKGVKKDILKLVNNLSLELLSSAEIDEDQNNYLLVIKLIDPAQ